MSDEPPEIGPDAWYKEVESRLHDVDEKLLEAARLTASSARMRARIDSHLAAACALIASVEDCAARHSESAVHPEQRDPPDVEFEDVPDFPGYRVGSDGSVWGCRKTGNGYGRIREWRRLQPYLVERRTRLAVTLYRDRVRCPRNVDALVMLAFVGPCPPGMQPCHANLDRLDNRLENLRYDRDDPESVIARAVRDARRRAESIVQSHFRFDHQDVSVCQACLVEFPCDARCVGEDVLALCKAIGPPPSADLAQLWRSAPD